MFTQIKDETETQKLDQVIPGTLLLFSQHPFSNSKPMSPWKEGPASTILGIWMNSTYRFLVVRMSWYNYPDKLSNNISEVEPIDNPPAAPFLTFIEKSQPHPSKLHAEDAPQHLCPCLLHTWIRKNSLHSSTSCAVFSLFKLKNTHKNNLWNGYSENRLGERNLAPVLLSGQPMNRQETRN